MTHDPVSLEFLGEQLKRVQADIRDLKGRVLLVETDQASMARDLARVESKVDALAERTEDRFDHVDQRFEVIDRRFDAIDRRFDAVDGRFEGSNRSAATNLQIILTAIDGLGSEIRELKSPG